MSRSSPSRRAGWGEMLFRDWPRALERASVVVWTKGATAPDPRGRPLVRVRLALDPPEDPRRSLWIVTGVGDGRSVVDAAQAGGLPHRAARELRGSLRIPAEKQVGRADPKGRGPAAGSR